MNGLRTMFWASVPRDFMRRVVLLLRTCYERADHVCRAILEMEDSEADNTRSWVRRGLIEGGLRQIILPPMTAEIVLGRHAAVPNMWNHTLIRSGNVLMTQCKVQHYDQIVQPSFARETYALPNEEQYLFPEMQPPNEPNTNPLYGIIIHDQDLGQSDQLGLIYVRFPRPGCAEWYPESIDLRLEFPELWGGGAIEIAPEEQVGGPDDPQILGQEDSA